MLKKEKKYAVGIDVGGSKMLAILFDGKKVVAEYQLATPKEEYNTFLVMLKAVVDPLIERAQTEKVKVSGIGLGIAGVIDYSESRMLRSPNIPIIDNQKVGDDLAQMLGIPVIMDNDAHCMVLAEAKIGAGAKYKNVFGVIIGTGIGGAWFHDGKVYHGEHGGACEPGAMIVDYKNNLSLETAYHQLTQNNPANLAIEAYRGDELANKSYQEFGELLGMSLANIGNILDPEIFILAGGASQSDDLFLPITKKALISHLYSSRTKKEIKIAKAKLGNLAGAIGAAMLVQN